MALSKLSLRQTRRTQNANKQQPLPIEMGELSHHISLSPCRGVKSHNSLVPRGSDYSTNTTEIAAIRRLSPPPQQGREDGRSVCRDGCLIRRAARLKENSLSLCLATAGKCAASLPSTVQVYLYRT